MEYTNEKIDEVLKPQYENKSDDRMLSENIGIQSKALLQQQQISLTRNFHQPFVQIISVPTSSTQKNASDIQEDHPQITDIGLKRKYQRISDDDSENEIIKHQKIDLRSSSEDYFSRTLSNYRTHLQNLSKQPSNRLNLGADTTDLAQQKLERFIREKSSTHVVCFFIILISIVMWAIPSYKKALIHLKSGSMAQDRKFICIMALSHPT